MDLQQFFFRSNSLTTAGVGWGVSLRLGSGLLPCPGFPFRGSISVCRAKVRFSASFSAEEPIGSPKFLTPSLHACHALRWTPADPREPHPCGSSVLASDTVNTVAIRIKRHDGAVSSFGDRALSCGLHASLCTLQLTRSVFLPPQSQLQHSVGVDG